MNAHPLTDTVSVASMEDGRFVKNKYVGGGMAADQSLHVPQSVRSAVVQFLPRALNQEPVGWYWKIAGDVMESLDVACNE